MSDDGEVSLFFMDKDGKELLGPRITSKELYVRTENMGNEAAFEYSFDGRSFKLFGPEFTLKFGMWTGDRLGVFCWNELRDSGYVDIDYFHYEYDGPKAK